MLFDIGTFTARRATWGQVALDRCTSLARSAWSGLRSSRLPAETAIGITASPGGYDAVLDGATRAARVTARIAARGIAWAARTAHRAATAASTAVVIAVARIHPPSGLAAANAVAAAQEHITNLRTQVTAKMTHVAGRVSEAAASPTVRQATVTAAGVARTVITVDRVTSGALIAWIAGRSTTAGRIARGAVNPWTLLGGIIGTFAISTGFVALRASAQPAHTAAPADTAPTARLAPVPAKPTVKQSKPATTRAKARKAA